jgi:hypothetical protein
MSNAETIQLMRDEDYRIMLLWSDIVAILQPTEPTLTPDGMTMAEFRRKEVDPALRAVARGLIRFEGALAYIKECLRETTESRLAHWGS